MTPAYGLIGYPLTHSFSPRYFTQKFSEQGIDATYSAFPLSDIKEFPALIDRDRTLRGLNVTIPYKEAIIPYLDSLSPEAEAIGAVNCIDIRNGKTKGYNTDVIGFEESLKPLLKPHHKQAFILGTGGASKAVAFVLKKLGIEYFRVSRRNATGSISYSALTDEMMLTHTIIINTTPLGTYPNIDVAPAIPYDVLGKEHLLYDLIYNPEETKFLKLGKQQGATIKNGLEMLHIQADASWEIWNRP